MPLTSDLKAIVSRIPEYSKWNHAEKVRFFAWFLHVYEKKERVSGAQIAECYDALHDEQPSSIHPFLVSMEKKNPKEAIRDGGGYYLAKPVRDELDGKYGKRASTLAVDALLAALPGKIPDKAERVFLEEAITCFENKAFRAAIVMTWNLTYFHLCRYVISHKLADFNAEYPKRHPGIHKRAKAPVISKIEDFASDLKESEMIEICRSANVITKDQFNALDRQIGRRNDSAHPSSVVITYLQAEEFMHDLIENVVLTVKI
jgi:hypothetical protein